MVYDFKKIFARMLIAKATEIVPNESHHSYSWRKLINCLSDLDFNSLYLQTFYISSNVAATSTSNKELNFTVDECNELASCSVSKQSNVDEKFFISPLPTAKLTHKKRKAKQATHITGSWFQKSITVSGTALKKVKYAYVRKHQAINKAKYICLLCIQPYEEPPPVMGLVGCKRSSRTGFLLCKILLNFFI